MTILEFTILLFCFSAVAGFVGVLTGLGGGVILIPVMVLLFHIDIHFAMGASLISVMATSAGSTLNYAQKNYINLRVGLFLQTAAVVGALFGASLVAFFSPSWLALIFGMVLIFSAYLTWRYNEKEIKVTPSHPWAIALKLEGTYPGLTDEKSYRVHHVVRAWFITIVAGLLSGLLGIGSGALNVVAMVQTMHLPYKVAAATSNFMIGITAAAGIGIYFAHGYIKAVFIFPLVVGVIIGAYLGSKVLVRLRSKTLRNFFSIIIFILAIEMIYKGLTGRLL